MDLDRLVKMNPKPFATIGERLAKRFFELRAKGRERVGVEVHLSRDELSALLGLAAEEGWNLRSRSLGERKAPAVASVVENSKLAAEMLAYHRDKPDLIAMGCAWKWTLYKHDQRIGNVFETRKEALAEGYRRFLNREPFLVKQITPKEPDPIRL